MHDDALVRAWMAGGDTRGEPIRRAVDAALVQDRSDRDRGRWIRNLSLGCAALLWIVLLWCAAHGITPLVRGGYALMAAGVAVLLFVEFSYASWNVQARPGPRDSLTQIHTTIVMLARQATLARTAPALVRTHLRGGPDDRLVGVRGTQSRRRDRRVDRDWLRDGSRPSGEAVRWRVSSMRGERSWTACSVTSKPERTLGRSHARVSCRS